ncbi:MAG: ATP synthase F1 subunit gamma [Candidatus Eremiobacteraeota bacterium]|nr:ATP synthase F1 subunit gamma [Candidatus Eremiobacteraeota bacterium]MBV8721832.1 ATP synthase F1 subunit gamma [Candidatus Eremiobacteraeota bacterium]
MPSVRDLRDRIKSLKNTQQITKAMKQVAAAKIRRAEIAQKQARPYADTLAEMLRDLMGAVSSVDHPFMKPGKAGAPPAILLVTADKGLAGAFNSNAIRAAEQVARERGNVAWYTVGNKARNAVRRLGKPDSPAWVLNAPSKLDTARDVARRVSDDFVNGTISEVTVVSQKLVSMMSQRPEARKLIPIESAALRETPGDAERRAPSGSVEFAGSPEFVLSRLLPKYLEFTIYSALLETDAAFFAAQLLAMTNATDNAKKLIDELTIQMNNARQAAITKELLEIVAGAEALGVE